MNTPAKYAAALVVVLAALSVALTACSPNGGQIPVQSESSSSGNRESGLTTKATPPSAATPAASSFQPAGSASPLGRILPKLSQLAATAKDDDPAAVAAKSAREKSTSECMKKNGFEYFPIEYSAEYINPIPVEDVLVVPALEAERESVAKHGYGLKAPSQESRTQLSRGEKKNNDYVATLSESSRREYDIALMGYDSQRAATSEKLGGCRAEAEAKHPEVARPLQTTHEDLSGFGFKVRTLQQEDIFRQSDVVALNREWRKCVTAKGIDAETYARSIPSPSAEGPRSAISMATDVDAEGNSAPLDYDGPTADLPEGQRSLDASAPEIKIALADFDCRAKTDYLNRFRSAQFVLEKKFIADNRQEIDSLLSLADQQGK